MKTKNYQFSYQTGNPGLIPRVLKISTFLLLFLTAFSFSGRATHALGGEVSYSYVSGNQYHIRLAIYRDCGGTTLGTAQAVNVRSVTVGVSFNQNANLNRTSVINRSILCPGQVSNCNGGTVAGVEEHVYEGNVTLPGTPADYIIAFSLCCRPNGVTNLNQPGNQELYLSTNLKHDLVLNNNSPVFLNPPIGKFCVGQPATLSPNAFDADGDAIVYSIISARRGTTASPLNATYLAPFTATSPLSTASGVTINPNTGLITFTPTVSGQRAVIAIRAEEYRNNAKIGEITRDMEVTTITCNSNSAPVIAALPNVVVPIGSTYTVNVAATDADNNNITLTATSGILPPGTFILNSSVPGAANATFSFTATPANFGQTYAVSVNAADNNCPNVASAVATFNLTVPAICSVTSTNSSTPATCGFADGTATASMSGGVGPYQYSWAGPNGYTSFAQNATGMYAGTYTITIVDGNSCVDVSTVVVSSTGSLITLSETVTNTQCGLNNGSIEVVASGGIAPYVFSLNGGTAQTSGLFENLAAGSYTVTAADNTGCPSTGIYTVNASVDNTPPVAICQGITVVLDANGHALISATQIDFGSYDLCDIPTLTISKDEFTCDDLGVSTVTLTATDAHSNSASCTASVTVIDNIAPEVECLPATIYLDANGHATLDVMDVFDHAHEACTVVTKWISKTDFDCSNLGANTVTVSAMDNSNNVGTCDAVVTVIDNLAPVPDMTNLPQVTAECSVNVAAPTATDNCAGSVTATTTDATSFNAQGSYSITWTYDDGNGNTSSQTQSVVIDDNTAPTPDVASLPSVTGECWASVTTAPTATDNCAGSVTGTTTDPTSYSAQGTYTINWTYDDGNGNTSMQTQTVTVADMTAPEAHCKNMTLNLSGGNGSITAADVNDGSTDNCGIASMSVSPDAFTCANTGANTVTLTVTDIAGHTSSCTSIVTVQYQPSCSISVIPANTIYTGGVPTTIYLGYGPQSATLKTNATGGSGFTYAWSPAANLSNANIQSPVFTPTAAGNYSFTVTVTNSNGCVTTCTVSFCVFDIRVPGKNGAPTDKVYLCHLPPGNPGNPQLLSISVNAVPAHIGLHAGDHLGLCSNVCNVGAKAGSGQNEAETVLELPEYGFSYNVYPNPTGSTFCLQLASENHDNAMIEIFDMTGRSVYKNDKIEVFSKFCFGQDFIPGVYVMRLTQGEYVKSERLIKSDR